MSSRDLIDVTMVSDGPILKFLEVISTTHVTKSLRIRKGKTQKIGGQVDNESGIVFLPLRIELQG